MEEEDIVNRVLDGMKFYEIVLQGYLPGGMTICTYRPKEAVQELFHNMKASGVSGHYVEEVHIELIKNSGNMMFPIFCVELHSEYKSLDDLAEDLMASRLSGLIDREMEGM